MKKTLVMVMAAAAISFTSCVNGNKATATDETDSIKVNAVIDNDLEDLLSEISGGVEALDGDALESSIEAFKARIQALINAGNGEVAQKYIDAFKQYVETNKEQITAISTEATEEAETTLADLVQKAANLPKEVVGTAKTAAEGIANDAVDKVNEEVEKAKTEAADKANEAVDKTKGKANDAIDEQQKKANDAVNKAADDVRNKLGL